MTGFGGDVVAPEDIVLVELVADGGGGARVIGQRVGIRAEEAFGGCGGFLGAEAGRVGYVHVGLGSGQ